MLKLASMFHQKAFDVVHQRRKGCVMQRKFPEMFDIQSQSRASLGPLLESIQIEYMILNRQIEFWI